MARRFGRNKRRQMRERITSLLAAQAEVHTYLGEARNEANELRLRLRRWAEDISHLLGRASAYNERPMSLHVEDISHLGGILRMEPMRMAELVRPGSQISEFAKVIELLIHTAEISKESRDRMSQQMRIKIESRDGQIAYAINQDRAKNWSPSDIKCMADMIAHQMEWA